MASVEKDNISSGSSGKEEKIEDVQHYPTKTDTNEKNAEKLDTYATANLNAVFENPLAGLSREALMEDVEEFCRKFDLMDHIESFRKGALASQNPSAIHDIPELNQDDIAILEKEKQNKWDQPWRLYWLVSTLSLCWYRFICIWALLANASPQLCVRSPLPFKVWTRRPTVVPSPSSLGLVNIQIVLSIAS